MHCTIHNLSFALEMGPQRSYSRDAGCRVLTWKASIEALAKLQYWTRKCAQNIRRFFAVYAGQFTTPLYKLRDRGRSESSECFDTKAKRAIIHVRKVSTIAKLNYVTKFYI